MHHELPQINRTVRSSPVGYVDETGPTCELIGSPAQQPPELPGPIASFDALA